VDLSPLASLRRLRVILGTSRSPYLLLFLLSGCALEDSHVAKLARSRLVGLSEVALESCIGAPDQHTSFGRTDVLTYYASSTNNINWTLPIVGGLGSNNGGYCHATFQVVDGQVVRVLYSGEKNAPLAADAFCAPIVRTCLANVDDIRRDTIFTADASASKANAHQQKAASIRRATPSSEQTSGNAPGLEPSR
jgi:hypothetical protein